MLTITNSVYYEPILRMTSIAGYKVVPKVSLAHLQVAFSNPVCLQMRALYPNGAGCLDITVQPQPLGRTVQTAPPLFEVLNQVNHLAATPSFCWDLLLCIVLKWSDTFVQMHPILKMEIPNIKTSSCCLSLSSWQERCTLPGASGVIVHFPKINLFQAFTL